MYDGNHTQLDVKKVHLFQCTYVSFFARLKEAAGYVSWVN